MKQVYFFLTVISLMVTSKILCQDAKSFYDQGMVKAYAGKLEEAIAFFDKSIELDQSVYVVWFNRGMAKAMLNDYEGALPDYEQTLKLYPLYKAGYLNRGTVKKHLTDYDAAIADYSYSIQLDPNYADAFYNRGLVYEMLDKKDSACADFKKARKNGLKYADQKIEKCKENSLTPNNYFSILRLTKTAENDKYGFTREDPIKVGCGPNGGPANQEAYLDLLRDKQGKAVKYRRLGSCCMYDSPNGLFGKGRLDQYEILYRNNNNKEVKSILYISFDDYEELKIPFGFKTIGQK